MSQRYVAVNWNRQKAIYDRWMVAGVLASIAVFAITTLALHPDATAETAVIRGLGFTGLLLLHLILAIGPAARLDPRWLPLLYNRRHLGVTLGIVALAHSVFVIYQYHALGDISPFVSVLVANGDYTSLANFPFELFGIATLAILLLMAATSHDFWLSVLTPRWWKRLHMLVYVAYLSLLLHVALGFLQDQRHPIYPITLLAAGLGIGVLHLLAARGERTGDRRPTDPTWVDVGDAKNVAEGRAVVALVGDERVAIFRHQNKLSCVSNVCPHQNGPLGEGKIVDGCITCPWHGYQFRPETGKAPPPFTDQIQTFNLRVVSGRVQVHPTPNPLGTYVEPHPVPAVGTPEPEDEFYVGYHPRAPRRLRSFTIRTVTMVFASSLGMMVMFAAAQTGFAPARFEFGRPTTVEGTIRSEPFPMLEVDRPSASSRSRYLLTSAGKHGADTAIARRDGYRVAITGTLAYRGNVTLLEVAKTAAVGPSADPAIAPIELGTFRLEGEIVDSKCFAGVMNPGQGKTHRSCAARCLSGGIPPLFVARDSTGSALNLLLVGPQYRKLPSVARLAGRRVILVGKVSRQDDLWFFRVDSLPQGS